MGSRWPSQELEIFALSLDGLWDASLPIAASRAGAVGVLHLVHLTDSSVAVSQVRRLAALARGRFGVLLSGRPGGVTEAVLDVLREADLLLFSADADSGL